ASVTASTTAGAAWPRISGPHDPTKSMYERPSASHSRAPSPRWMNGGAPPTARNARTGLLTPPGITRLAASSRRLDSLMRKLHGYEVAPLGVPAECGDRIHAPGHHGSDDVHGGGI